MNSLQSNIAFKLKEGVAFQLAGTASGMDRATAYLLPDFRTIRVDLGTAVATSTFTINTPFNFKLANAICKTHAANATTGAIVIVKNGSTTLLTSAAIATAATSYKSFVAFTGQNYASNSFSNGDNDLVVTGTVKTITNATVWLSIDLGI